MLFIIHVYVYDIYIYLYVYVYDMCIYIDTVVG